MNIIYLTDTGFLNNEAEFNKILLSLPPWRRQEIEKKKNYKSRIQSAAVFYLAQKAIEKSEITGEIKKDCDGRPFIEGSDYYISFSHSHSLAAVAVSEFPVGIDAEKNRPQIPKAVKILGSDIQKLIKTPSDFMKYWTMYEAHLKLGGSAFLKDGCFFKTFNQEDYTISVCTNHSCDFSVNYTLI